MTKYFEDRPSSMERNSAVDALGNPIKLSELNPCHESGVFEAVIGFANKLNRVSAKGKPYEQCSITLALLKNGRAFAKASLYCFPESDEIFDICFFSGLKEGNKVIQPEAVLSNYTDKDGNEKYYYPDLIGRRLWAIVEWNGVNQNGYDTYRINFCDDQGRNSIEVMNNTPASAFMLNFQKIHAQPPFARFVPNIGTQAPAKDVPWARRQPGQSYGQAQTMPPAPPAAPAPSLDDVLPF